MAGMNCADVDREDREPAEGVVGLMVRTLAELEEIRREAWNAWLKSKTMPAADENRTSDAKADARLRKSDQVGDSRYLKMALTCIERRTQLLDLKKLLQNDPGPRRFRPNPSSALPSRRLRSFLKSRKGLPINLRRNRGTKPTTTTTTHRGPRPRTWPRRSNCHASRIADILRRLHRSPRRRQESLRAAPDRLSA
jgi:Fe-S cluster biosynthesis and repair protein YggX